MGDIPTAALAPCPGDLVAVRQRFAALASCLLQEHGHPQQFRDTANGLYELLDELGGRPQELVGAAAFPWQQETLLPEGKAINPYSAATCLLDSARTRAFARGVNQAIRAAFDLFPDARIEILYAGTGPFAPLALLQTAFFPPEQVSFTLIDIHEPALTCLGQIVSALGLENYIESTVAADALRWQPQNNKKYHVVVSEVMQRALAVEPQVAVTLALSRHLHLAGFLVPEAVELSLCLLDPEAEMHQAIQGVSQLTGYFSLSGDRIAGLDPATATVTAAASRTRMPIKSVFTLTRSVGQDYRLTDEGRIPLAPVQLPDALPPGNSKLYVLTRITTFDNLVLRDYDSGLTFPEPVQPQPQLAPGSEVSVWYETQGVPGLKIALQAPFDYPATAPEENSDTATAHG